MTGHPLDNPAWEALTGPHARLAERYGLVLRYPVDVSPFIAVADPPDPAAWADLAALANDDGVIGIPGNLGPVPPDWKIVLNIPGVQFVDERVAARFDPEAVELGPTDVPEMLDLVARAKPGPFLPRTIELGTYLGIRRGGALVAMAGERLHPPGFTEISAVCTDDAYRGQGLATRLVLAVAAGIRDRGETPFLHASAYNTNAIRLYESLGFALRRTTSFLAARVPAAATVG